MRKVPICFTLNIKQSYESQNCMWSVDVILYVPKKSPLTMTVPTVSKLNVVNIVLRVEDFRTPQAITTKNR